MFFPRALQKSYNTAGNILLNEYANTQLAIDIKKKELHKSQTDEVLHLKWVIFSVFLHFLFCFTLQHCEDHVVQKDV